MTRRQKTIAFFVTLCVLLVAAAVSLNVGWILISGRRLAALVFGMVLFGLIIAGLIVYTVFLVMEIKRNEEHDSFINAVTHELKTPIASIRLYLETLQSREVNDGQRREFYNIMLADADRLHNTVNQVLKAGVLREKPGAAGARAAVVDVAALALDCVELARLRHHLQPEAVELQVQQGASLLVKGDAEELRTVLANLLDNAVKYSGQGVRITVAVVSPAPHSLWVRVVDHGVGIPKRQLKRIFNRFYRVQPLGLKAVKGTGLGLYIVRSIARAHGGRVFAHSEGEGRGATFTVELPRFAGEPDAVALQPKSA
jgi:two-component system, OmpR family, sensor histidine kinase SenX3